jgi:hypothetical protein
VALAPGGGEDLRVEIFGRLEVVLRALAGVGEVLLGLLDHRD